MCTASRKRKSTQLHRNAQHFQARCIVVHCGVGLLRRNNTVAIDSVIVCSVPHWRYRCVCALFATRHTRCAA